MLTKKQFCECILEKFYKSEGVSSNEWKNVYALQSTCAGKAAAFLDLIQNQELLKYLDQRGGTLYMHYDVKTGDANFLTMEDMLSLLPESI